MFLPHELKSELDLISNRKNIKYKSQIQTKSTEKIRREAKKKKKEMKRVKSKGKRGGRWNPEWQCYRIEHGHGNSRAFSWVKLRGITRLLVVRVQMWTVCTKSQHQLPSPGWLQPETELLRDLPLRWAILPHSCLTEYAHWVSRQLLVHLHRRSTQITTSQLSVCVSVIPFSPSRLVPNPDRLWHTWVGVSVLSQSQ